MMTVDELMTSWTAFVAEWSRLESSEAGGGDAMLSAALEHGLPETATSGGEDVHVTDADLLACEIALMRLAGAIDEDLYRARTPGTVRPDLDPVEDFCRQGWRNVRNPNPEFDVWWYWNEYLDAADERLDPFLHFLLVGRRAGLRGLPTASHDAPPVVLAGESPRRACLFAAFDVDGVVDPYVVEYVRELSRFADVYYLAACRMDDGELEKLDGLVAGAWAVPHDRYDFGSYSMLARDLVGWDALEQYDEVLLVNDSCYLLRPLDDLFATMTTRACDWWGLQLTSRWFDGDGPDRAPRPIEQVRQEVPRSVMHPDEHPHVGSFFLAFRKPVIADGGFRKRLDRVAHQQTKIQIVYKYETGTTRYLIGQGYRFDTYLDALHPYHPMYSTGTFDRIAEGVPLLKRQLLSENPYDLPDLRDWKARVVAAAPGADVATMEQNLLRVAADDRLHRSFSIVTGEDGAVRKPRLRNNKGFRIADGKTPKFDHWWAFPVCAYDHTFAGNERAVFEEVRDDPSIKKIILTRSRRVDVEGENVVIVPLDSPEGQYHLLRSGQIFVKHGPIVNLTRPIDPKTHNVINTWHGIPLKRFGLASAHLADRTRESMIRNHGASRAIISSSHMDTLAMAAAFFPASYPDLWPTGLPRNDFILRDEDQLPADLRATLDRLREELDGRRLVMFLPTFRDGQGDSQYEFDESELKWLADWAERHHAVLGVREHMADKARTYSSALLPLGAIDLSSRRYPDLEVLYRAADALISDYSSCLVDFMLTGKPVMSFAYDYDRYANDERGLFYELDRVLPGPVCRTFDELATALDSVFDAPTPEQVEEYDWKRRIFFDHIDDQASWRVVQRVKGLYVDDD
ncbi:CDP-glycerol glycerophosphotransferase family protein [Aeromicrobium wangtongii]|uniref:CDP-glycerol glycerophosphotransferase family protein n=1 Tax=Aeromicrobium wangtongii TaxID=2969247 RepID=UPI002016BBD4|nr:CDP-glycerol glycerophosphotransferase family protein [Aeromicrobium wangtongii]MCL3816991.1 CDP-glycerol glycerophosphotransferase family protein [Aeromicrobium wangtongii]